jgi:hypothetical protein
MSRRKDYNSPPIDRLTTQNTWLMELSKSLKVASNAESSIPIAFEAGRVSQELINAFRDIHDIIAQLGEIDRTKKEHTEPEKEIDRDLIRDVIVHVLWADTSTRYSSGHIEERVDSFLRQREKKPNLPYFER